MLFKCLADELYPFRLAKRPRSNGALRIRLTSLPTVVYGGPYPTDFMPFRWIQPQMAACADKVITRDGLNAINVIARLRSSSIHAGVIPNAQMMSDTVYHRCFSQPASLWFKRKGLFFLHAGCVAKGGDGILIIGHSRAGKSTLALTAVQAGFRFLSDEQPLLSRKGGRVLAHSFPRRVKISRHLGPLFPNLQKRAAEFGDEERIIFPIEEIWPGAVTPACEPKLLLFPEYCKGSPLQAKRMAPVEALSRLLQDDYFVWHQGTPWSRVARKHLELFQDLTRQAPAFSLRYDTHLHHARIPGLLSRLLRDA